MPCPPNQVCEQSSPAELANLRACQPRPTPLTASCAQRKLKQCHSGCKLAAEPSSYKRLAEPSAMAQEAMHLMRERQTSQPFHSEASYDFLVTGAVGSELELAASVDADATLERFDDFLQSKLGELRVSILREIRQAKYVVQGARDCLPDQRFGNPEWSSHVEGKPSSAKVVEPILTSPTAVLENSVAPISEKEECPEDVSAHSPVRVKVKDKHIVLSDGDSENDSVLRDFRTAEGLWESVMICVVLVNFLVMTIEVQMHGSCLGHGLRNGGQIQPDETAVFVFTVLEYGFAFAYTVDLAIALATERWQWPKLWWNWLDLMIVCATFADLFFTTITVNPTTLKILRLGRFLRMAKMGKVIAQFEVCFILGRSLIKSVSALVWSALFIFMFILVSGLFVSQFLSAFLENESIPVAKRLPVYEAYGTFSRAVLTMFEVTLGNWGPPTWLLVDNVHEGFMVVFILYKITCGFAALNVINAVFLRQTMKCSEEIDDFNIRQKRKAQGVYMQRLSELFDEMDSSGDGSLTFIEFQTLMESPSVVAWLDLLDISVKDSEQLFKTLDGGDGLITIKEWLDGISRIRGHATATDSLAILSILTRVESCLANMYAELRPDEGRPSTVPRKRISVRNR